MSNKMDMPTAVDYLEWAGKQNPGPWIDHSYVVAHAAQKIAEKCIGLDADKAYVLGLLHDIGRYAGVTSVKHIYDGYKLMKREGHDEVAQICLTHSYPLHNFKWYVGGANDCSEAETAELVEELGKAVYSDYDRLIQLCDSLASAEGVCLMEKRLLDVAMRYGVKPHSQAYWQEMFKIRDDFSNKIGGSIYALFPEAREITFQ